MHLNDIDTPGVFVDLDIMERNVRRMHEHLSANKIAIRPHIKNHKIPAIAHFQMREGAIGITCQKVSEAEVMVDSGITDVMIAYNIVGRTKLERLARLAHSARMSVVADSEFVIRGLSEMARAEKLELAVMVEFDIAAQRSGVRTGADAIRLARAITNAPGLRYKGLASFRGYSPDVAYIHRTSQEYREVVSALERDGIATEVISSGGTVEAWTAWPENKPWGVNECRPGLYTFYDRVKVQAGVATLADCALRVSTTVISRPTDGLVILDAGEKTLTESRYRFKGGEGCGTLVEYPEAIITSLFEEHAVVDVSACQRAPQCGEIVTVIPNYSSLVVNLVDEVYGVRGDYVETIWPVAARGKTQ